MKNFIRKGKWLWIVCFIIVLSVLCVKIIGFFIGNQQILLGLKI